MTGPFGPPLSRKFCVIILSALIFAIALPFARRQDLLGWIAFLMIFLATTLLWSILLTAAVNKIFNWLRKRSE